MEALPAALDRLGVVMRADPADEREAWGVLNPAGARAPDGTFYLFPRLVAAGNYSRIGRARVELERGLPRRVTRLGIALEPAQPWELKGVEDARVTHVAALGRYVMAYTAYSSAGPRVALAVSADLVRWQRLGPARFGELDAYDNKDACLFPEPVIDPAGERAYALLHRPANEPRPRIWVSFADAGAVEADLGALASLDRHRAVAGPEQPWEELKIGAGPPPVATERGWLLIYHGVSGRLVAGRDHQPSVRYSAGAMLLERERVWEVTARRPEPLLEPETVDEREGIVGNVVFPTALDAETGDVYYGMADSRIGVARLRWR